MFFHVCCLHMCVSNAQLMYIIMYIFVSMYIQLCVCIHLNCIIYINVDPYVGYSVCMNMSCTVSVDSSAVTTASQGSGLAPPYNPQAEAPRDVYNVSDSILFNNVTVLCTDFRLLSICITVPSYNCLTMWVVYHGCLPSQTDTR